MRVLYLCFLVVLLATTSRAHDPEVSSLKIIRSRSATLISVSTHISKLRVGQSTSALDGALRTRLQLRLDGKKFAPAQSRVLRDLPTDSVTWQAEYSGVAERIEVRARLFPEAPASRMTVLVFDDGRLIRQSLLNRTRASVTLDLNEAGERESTQAASARAWTTPAALGLLMIIVLAVGGLVLRAKSQNRSVARRSPTAPIVD